MSTTMSGKNRRRGIQWLTNIAEWKNKGEIERGFDESNGRLIIKGKGKLEAYRDGSKACPMMDYPSWYERLKDK